MPSGRGVGRRHVVASDAFLTVLLVQNDLIVRPYPVAQIVEHLDHGHGLLRRPMGVNEQWQSVARAGGLMCFHDPSFVLRFFALAVADSCASLRRNESPLMARISA